MNGFLAQVQFIVGARVSSIQEVVVTAPQLFATPQKYSPEAFLELVGVPLVPFVTTIPAVADVAAGDLVSSRGALHANISPGSVLAMAIQTLTAAAGVTVISNTGVVAVNDICEFASAMCGLPYSRELCAAVGTQVNAAHTGVALARGLAEVGLLPEVLSAAFAKLEGEMGAGWGATLLGAVQSIAATSASVRAAIAPARLAGAIGASSHLARRILSGISDESSCRMASHGICTNDF